MENVLNRRYGDETTEDTPESTILTPLGPRNRPRTRNVSSPTVASSNLTVSSSPATIISDITFILPEEEETKAWSNLQRRKIIEETESLRSAIGEDPCCKRDCISYFTLETIKAKRYSFNHLGNANKRYHLSLCRQSKSNSRSRCCVECMTRVTGVSRNILYDTEPRIRNMPIDTKGAKIAVWLMDLAGFADRMPDKDEYHIPFMNKVNLQLILMFET